MPTPLTWDSPAGFTYDIARPEGAFELYNLKTDLAEKHNLAAAEPERVLTLKNILQTAITTGRTTPGPMQKNDRPVRMQDQKAALIE